MKIKIYYSVELKRWIVYNPETDQIFGTTKTEVAAKKFKKYVEDELCLK